MSIFYPCAGYPQKTDTRRNEGKTIGLPAGTFEPAKSCCRFEQIAHGRAGRCGLDRQSSPDVARRSSEKQLVTARRYDPRRGGRIERCQSRFRQLQFDGLRLARLQLAGLGKGFQFFLRLVGLDADATAAQSVAMCRKEPMQADGIVRPSKVEVHPEYLDEYMAFAKEVGATSLRTEPGVLTMYAVADKANPCRITILETYSSQEAYKKHIASEHFQKYKLGTLHMVKNLVLDDVVPLNPDNRISNFIRH